MKTEAYLMIPKKRLSTVKANVIPYQIEQNGPVCGHVSKIIEEVQPNVFKCLIDVSPEFEDYVLKAMEKERQKLANST